ncbi:hypothetical protein AVEN_20192-1 [Araneus ventricosus]|uniref:Uncharacterized protein n=1 Tax=Araneus ventricosus TaxID=182803 RepID=A0A4Y2CLY4_ARAVE|nr:hypothetical protein AVEN_20192-1 [Araneus ventricosus]
MRGACCTPNHKQGAKCPSAGAVRKLGEGCQLRRRPSHLTAGQNCEFSLVILTSRFEATRGLFWERHRHFEPRSDDEDDSSAGTLLSKLPYHTSAICDRLRLT